MADGVILQTGSPQHIYQAPACPEVGSFIGSPGMDLINCRIEGGEVFVADRKIINEQRPGLSDGDYRLGVRPEWVTVADDQSGDWRVTASKVLGTYGGEVRTLVSVTCGNESAQVETTGEWRRDTAVALGFEKFVLFDGDRPVTNG